MTILGAILLSSCGSSDDSLQKNQESTTTAQIQIILPADQISALVYSYVASAIQSRPNLLKATSSSKLMECVTGEATTLGNSLLPTFTVQEPANTAIMQQVQQDLERFIAQCSTR